MRVLILLWLAFSPVFAGGSIVEVVVPGPSLEGNLLEIPSERTVSVYLPPDYDSNLKRRYPTLYILHGIFDTNRTWTHPWDDGHPGFDTIQAVMDAGIEDGAFGEMIVVVPDSDKACHYTDSAVRGNWERFISKDLVDTIDRRYRTIDDADARGLAGHSMGGHGAIKLGMKHPDVFGAIYALNPSLLGWGGDVNPDNPAFAKLSELRSLDQLSDANFYLQAVVAVGHCFAPNPESPLLTDLPFGQGEKGIVAIQPGHDRWQSQMPIYMVPRYVENLKRLNGIRFDSAFEEEFSHIPVTSRELSRVLTEHGIEHTFEMYNGDHRNRLWGRQGRVFTELLPYFSRLFAEGERVP